MHIPRVYSDLQRRQTDSSSSSGLSYLVVIIVIAVSFILVLLFIAYIFLRRLRAKNRSPKYIPTAYLKRKWQGWTPQKKYGQSTPRDRNRNLNMSNTYNGRNNNDAGSNTADVLVDRHASVRSVMTLPAYSQNPKDTEQVIGREGERAGMDTVVEFPETAEEQETLREEQMDSLYQIRAARRRELADREARRLERRDARDRGDAVRLEELRRESRSRAVDGSLSNLSLANSTSNLSAAALLAEHQSRGRDRKISSVAYAAVGHVRHDGSRVRAHSNDSERGGLLDGAAPMGERSARGRDTSDATFHSNLTQNVARERSGSSALSISTTASDPEGTALGQVTPLSIQETQGQLLVSSRGSDPTTSNSSPATLRLTPDESLDSDDLGEERPVGIRPGHDSHPPNYEQVQWGDVPPYIVTSNGSRQEPQYSSARTVGGPIQLPSTANRLPLLTPVPSITVVTPSEPNTPALPSSEGFSR